MEMMRHRLDRNYLTPLAIIILLCIFFGCSVKKAEIAKGGICQVGFQENVWEDTQRNRLIKAAIWYPSSVPSEKIRYMKIYPGKAKKDASILEGTFPLVLISHGTGGHCYSQYYLSEFLASNGYIVVAVEHPFDNLSDNSQAYTIKNLWHRPKDISFVLSQVLHKSKFVDSIDTSRVGIIGHSLGGYTALVLAGAVPNWSYVIEFCKSPGDRKTYCEKVQEELEQWKQGNYYDYSKLYDNRIKAVFVMAPGVPHVFKKSEMRNVTIPVYIVTSGRDEILKGDEKRYLKIFPAPPKHLEFPDAGHFVYLMECPLIGKMTAWTVCRDKGTPRSEIHPKLQQESLQFFNQHL